MQYFTGKDEVTYRGYVKKLKQKPDIELVAGVDGAPDVKLLWIGKKEAKKVVYFLHGEANFIFDGVTSSLYLSRWRLRSAFDGFPSTLLE